MTIARTWIVAAISAVAFASLAQAQDLNPKSRQELKRADLTGTNMEVIISVVENQPGETIPLCSSPYRVPAGTAPRALQI